ncbi:MAG TPA: hypothetical protein VG870_05520 [Chitinophagaceae bacterium]|nr:hypothetical protein [Chitinophagaceae bacterium]
MKKSIWLVLLVAAGALPGQAQSLKDLLYGGKLKNDSGTVVRKTDDLRSKIDTTTRKPAPVQAQAGKPIPADSAGGVAHPAQANPTGGDVTAPGEPTQKPAEVKDNNRLWKEYMDSVISGVKTDVLPSKKIRKGTYYIFVDYEIGTDGQVTIHDVVPSPESGFLKDQLKERLDLAAPRMMPVLGSNGQPRKVQRKYNFTLTKD